MEEKNSDVLVEFHRLFKGLEQKQQAEIAAQLFMEYCINQDLSEHTKRLAPLINTVAEALTRHIEGEDPLKLGVSAVQTYLRMPNIESFGETLVRLGFLDKQTINEMRKIRPKGIKLGSFLLAQGLITQEQCDMTFMAQKRLFSIQEVYARILNGNYQDNVADLIDSLKGVFKHFLVTTSELENDLKQSRSENIHDILQRLEDIIVETEKQSQMVLGIVDQIFVIKDEIGGYSECIKKDLNPADRAVISYIEKISERLDQLYHLNMDLNSSQQIQDRIGQQMLKIIPSIQVFHDQLLKIATKLNLDLKKPDEGKNDLTKEGYGGAKTGERVQQGDIDDLLSSLGL